MARCLLSWPEMSSQWQQIFGANARRDRFPGIARMCGANAVAITKFGICLGRHVLGLPPLPRGFVPLGAVINHAHPSALLCSLQ